MTRSLPPTRLLAERGYSLVEVMIAAGVMAGVLLSISTMFISGTQSVRSGRDMTRATTIASSAMEDVMTLPFELVFNLPGGVKTDETKAWDTTLPIPTLAGSAEDVALMTAMLNSWTEQVETELAAGELSYRVDGVVRPAIPGNDLLEPFEDATYLRVTITVSWTESRGRNRQVSFEGLVV